MEKEGTLLTGSAGRWLGTAYDRLIVPVTLAIGMLGLVRLGLLLHDAITSPGALGIDYATVMDAARRWTAGDSPYLARQLAGPYRQIGANTIDSGEFLYPPIALLFLAPFTILPAVLWWTIPGGLALVGLRRLRPARSSWPILALLMATGQSIPILIAGNPTIWIIGAALLAPTVPWIGPWILLKPSVAPLALFGIRRRSWWLSAGLLALACLPFGALWGDWMRAVVNMRASGPPGLAYAFAQMPMLFVPVVAFVSRLRQPDGNRDDRNRSSQRRR